MSPSGMKHTSWLSGLLATAIPRAAASARTSALVEPPSGNMARSSCSRVSTASTYDWSLPSSTLRRSRPPSSRAWCPVHTASKPSATARSSTAANLIFSLQRRHGLGVRPRAYSATKSSTTSRLNRSAMSQT